jgi:hypothetical protein
MKLMNLASALDGSSSGPAAGGVPLVFLSGGCSFIGCNSDLWISSSKSPNWQTCVPNNRTWPSLCRLDSSRYRFVVDESRNSDNKKPRSIPQAGCDGEGVSGANGLRAVQPQNRRHLCCGALRCRRIGERNNFPCRLEFPFPKATTVVRANEFLIMIPQDRD